MAASQRERRGRDRLTLIVHAALYGGGQYTCDVLRADAGHSVHFLFFKKRIQRKLFHGLEIKEEGHLLEVGDATRVGA